MQKRIRLFIRLFMTFVALCGALFMVLCSLVGYKLYRYASELELDDSRCAEWEIHEYASEECIGSYCVRVSRDVAVCVHRRDNETH